MAKDTLTWEQAQEIDEKFSDTGKGLRIVVFYVGGRGNVQELCIPGDDHAPRYVFDNSMRRFVHISGPTAGEWEMMLEMEQLELEAEEARALYAYASGY